MCDAASSPGQPVDGVHRESNAVALTGSPSSTADASTSRSGLRLAAPAVAADAVADREGRRQTPMTPNAVAASAFSDPPWLLTFILTPFYDACPVHSPRHRSERNRYDVVTGTKLCQYCVAARNKNGDKREAGSAKSSLIQLCRYMYSDCVDVEQLRQQGIDTSRLQGFTNNGATVVYLHRGPAPARTVSLPTSPILPTGRSPRVASLRGAAAPASPSLASAGPPSPADKAEPSTCIVCSRLLLGNFDFCSLYCRHRHTHPVDVDGREAAAAVAALSPPCRLPPTSPVSPQLALPYSHARRHPPLMSLARARGTVGAVHGGATAAAWEQTARAGGAWSPSGAVARGTHRRKSTPVASPLAAEPLTWLHRRAVVESPESSDEERG